MAKYIKYRELNNENVPIWSKMINQCLKDANMTQEELAIKSGVSKATITAWIKGDKSGRITEPKILGLNSIANTLNVSTDYLLGKAECKKADDEEIYKRLGLRSNAIKSLEELNKTQKDTLYLLNEFIASKDIFFIICLIQILTEFRNHADYNEEFEAFCIQKKLIKFISMKTNDFIKSKKTEEERQHDIIKMAKEYLKNYGSIMKEE